MSWLLDVCVEGPGPLTDRSTPTHVHVHTCAHMHMKVLSCELPSSGSDSPRLAAPGGSGQVGERGMVQVPGHRILGRDWERGEVTGQPVAASSTGTATCLGGPDCQSPDGRHGRHSHPISALGSRAKGGSKGGTGAQETPGPGP